MSGNRRSDDSSHSRGEYPPEPWHLAGQACLSVWAVPPDALHRVPHGLHPLTVGGRALVCTAWIDYQPEGQLAYHELLSAVVLRRGPRPTATITEIWVDSEISLAGGRELWGIPKDLAALDYSYGRVFTASAATQDDWIATAAFVPRGRAVPAPQAGFHIAQAIRGAELVSPVRSCGHARPATASWNVNPEGPLGYLASRSPVASANLKDFRLRFGHAPRECSASF